ncbi:MAG TPA: serine hydrolase domain-containing protein [Thermoanaerobaculia bacterium]|nr:serine hydrolase domain-containing protein [Thermoanaerobaculia bacterium]
MMKVLALALLLTGTVHAQSVPALGVGLIRDGKLREVRVEGELVQGQPAPYDTIFNVASLTKPLVAIVTLHLVAEGKWDLDEPLAKYWVDPDVAGDPRHRLLTTRHVLAHQTGFKNWRWLDDLEKLVFHFEPGTQHQYSGEGFEYLRRALEKKFGVSLAELSQKYVFDPLGMRDTQHAWDARTDESRFAQWHDAKGAHAYPDHKTTRVNAADDLLTTVEDYGRFAVWVMNGAGLPAPLFTALTSPQARIREHHAMSLGWELFTNLSGGEYALVHSGSDKGVKSLVIIMPKSRMGLVLMTNTDNGFALFEKVIIETLPLGKELMARAKG